MDIELQIFLGNIWFFIVGVMLVLYVVLDGFDLGVGVLAVFARDESERSLLMSSLGSVWDANETWLVVLGGALFGAFPIAYGTVLHALYIPIMLMIFALIFRGVSFEYHEHAENKRPWGVGFVVGSTLAAAAQGLALGAIIGGINTTKGIFTGSAWEWLTPFSLVVAVGVVFGYALLGATYLIMKTEGELQRRQYRYAMISAWIMLLVAAVVTIRTPFYYPDVADRWFSTPTFFYIAPLPIGASVAFWMLLRAIHRRHEHAPFVWTIIIFLCSFGGLAASLFPTLIPPHITVATAAASPKTLAFMLTGIGMLLPVMIIYNAYQYLVFRGKVKLGSHGH